MLYSPLLKWYLDHGLKIRAAHRTVDYVPQKAFKRFVEKVTENRRKVEQNTDSLYFALSCDSLKEAVRPELREEFQKWKKKNGLLGPNGLNANPGCLSSSLRALA